MNHHWLHTNHTNEQRTLQKPKVLTLQDHINMRGTQFLATASANPDHPCHYMLVHQPTPRSIKTAPLALYPQHQPPTLWFTHPHALHKHSHTKT